jgi:hypothetical protein
VTGTPALRPGSEVEVSWFPDEGERFDAAFLDGEAGKVTTFWVEDEDDGERAQVPALILSADVAADGSMASVRLRLLGPAGRSGGGPPEGTAAL